MFANNVKHSNIYILSISFAIKTLKETFHNKNEFLKSKEMNEAKILYHLPESDYLVYYKYCFFHKNINFFTNVICCGFDIGKFNFYLIMEYCEVKKLNL